MHHHAHLLSHQKTIHETHNSKQFNCSQCGKGFSKFKYKQSHEKIHEKYRVIYLCSFCEKGFNFMSSLRRHVKTDHEEATIKCDRCSFETKRKDVLKKHVANMHKPDDN